MKKLLWVLGGVLALVVAAILIAPNVVDWNGYKTEIADQVRKATGRTLTIGGDIDLQVFPAPALVAEDVAVSSLEGAQSADFAALKSVEVRVALLPLLGGLVRVETVRLVEPQIFLEVLADGRTTWDIAPTGGNSSPNSGENAQSGGANSGASGGPQIIIDQFQIVDGRVVYSDANQQTVETVDGINVTIAAGSLAEGPYKIEGSLSVSALPLTVDANVGSIVEGRTVPVDINVGVGGSNADINVKGTILGLNEQPRFRGDLSVTAQDVAKLVGSITGGNDLPAPLSRKLSLITELDASQTNIAMRNLTFDFGGATGRADVSAILTGPPQVSVTVDVDKIEADAWVKASPAGGTDMPVNTSKTTPVPAAPETAAPPSFSLPDQLGLTLSARVNAVGYKGDTVRDIVLNAELANGNLTLSQFSLTAPGSTSVIAFGTLVARDGLPSFDAELEASSEKVRELVEWVGLDLSQLRPGRPGALSVKARASGNPSNISMQNLSVVFDQTTVLGAATIAPGDRLGIGASVTVDRLNLDSYLLDEPAPKSETATQSPSSNTEPSQETAGEPAGNPLAGLSALADIDANIIAKVGSLTRSGITVRNADIDLGLLAGDLTIRKFSVADVAGASVALSGNVNGLGDLPEAKGLKFNAKAKSVAPIAKIAGLALPMPAKSIGAVSLAGELNGSLLKPRLAGTLKAFAANMDINGTVSPFDPLGPLDMAVRIRHANTASLLKRLGVAYRPSGEIGGLDVSSKVVGNPSKVRFSELNATIGPANVKGAGTLELSGVRPKVTADLATNAFAVDPFIPVQQTAMLRDTEIIPARYAVLNETPHSLLTRVLAVSDRWSREPIDLSGLGAADLQLNLTSPKLSYETYALENANVTTAINDSVLKVTDFTGSVFGGAFQSAATIDAKSAVPGISGQINLGNMDIGAASKAAGIAGTTGLLTTRIDVTTAGKSIADFVSTLGGKGAIQIKGIKGQQSLSDMPVIGLALGPLMNIFEVLNSGLGSLIGKGGQTGLGETDVTSTFTIANGEISTNDTAILSNVYQGNVAGKINLPTWTMDVNGKVAVDQGLLGAVLSNVARIPSEIPFSASGNIDKPKINIQTFNTTSGGGSGIPIPGLDKLEKKVPGVGNLLQGILGGGSSSGSSSGTTTQTPPSQSGSGNEPPAQQPPAQQQQRINPAEKLLRGLLGG